MSFDPILRCAHLNTNASAHRRREVMPLVVVPSGNMQMLSPLSCRLTCEQILRNPLSLKAVLQGADG